MFALPRYEVFFLFTPFKSRRSCAYVFGGVTLFLRRAKMPQVLQLGRNSELKGANGRTQLGTQKQPGCAVLFLQPSRPACINRSGRHRRHL